jgi:hypothetical protein
LLNMVESVTPSALATFVSVLRLAEVCPFSILLSIPRLMLARGIFAMAADSMVSATRASP